ncbi:MAG: glycosyltransferase family 9 protein [Cyanobacteria bacterium HKST-UBA03]|nr:glycosyltransferase family 9 protein [Cyanobacteria bacterium HKST-UBA03]
MKTVAKPIVLSDPPRICLVRLSALGDVIHTLPLLGQLRDALPDAHLGWIVEPAAEPLVNNHPLLDAVHVADRKRWLAALYNPLAWAGAWASLARFRAEVAQQRYDVVVDVQGLAKSGLVSWLSGVPQRMGFSPCREEAHRWYTHPVARPWPEFDPDHHVSHSYGMLAQSLTDQSTDMPHPLLPPVPEAAVQAAQAMLAPLGDRPIVVLAPATRWQSKHWPVKHWQKLVDGLMQESTVAVVGVGGHGDHGLVADVVAPATAQQRSLNLAGQTDLTTLQAVVKHAAVVVAPDSMTAHLAGALNHPAVLALFGPTSTIRTAPLGSRVSTLACGTPLDCQPCHSRTCHLPRQTCMEDLRPEAVLSRILESMNARNAGLISAR